MSNVNQENQIIITSIVSRKFILEINSLMSEFVDHHSDNKELESINDTKKGCLSYAEQIIYGELKNHKMFIALANKGDKKEIAGLIIAEANGGKKSEITVMYVKKDYRGKVFSEEKTVAKALYDRAIEWCKSKGAKKVKADVNNKNIHGQSFFKKQGYKQKTTILKKTPTNEWVIGI